MAHSHVQCEICNRNMRSDNLKRHMKSHKNGSTWSKPKEIPTFDGSEFETDKTNSKETMDQLKRFVLNEPPKKTARMESTSSQNSLEHKQNIPTKLFEKYMEPKSLDELWRNDDAKRNHDEDDEDDKDDDNEDEDVDNDDEEKMDDNDDDKLEETSVKLLPVTRIGLEKRFSKLFHEFT